MLATYERDVPIYTHPVVADLAGEAGTEVLVTYGDGRVVALSFAIGERVKDGVTDSLPTD